MTFRIEVKTAEQLELLTVTEVLDFPSSDCMSGQKYY